MRSDLNEDPKSEHAEAQRLIAPAVILKRFPLSLKAQDTVGLGRTMVRKALRFKDKHLLVIVGPCSIHDKDGALEYARRLSQAAKLFEEDLSIVMRCYFDKPRSSSGWTGLVNDPLLDGSNSVNDGLQVSRKLLVEITELGLPVACEIVHTEYVPYFVDLLSWIAIGARTSLSQAHRESASFVPVPVGFKNTIDGDVRLVIKAIEGATHAQVVRLPSDDGFLSTFAGAGNPDCHLVMRGGERGSNYGDAAISEASNMLAAAGLCPRVIVDFSHGNSGSDHTRQLQVALEIAEKVELGNDRIAGCMMESYLLPGRQPENGPPYEAHQSMTDPCIGWKETLTVLERLAQSARKSSQRLPSS